MAQQNGAPSSFANLAQSLRNQQQVIGKKAQPDEVAPIAVGGSNSSRSRSNSDLELGAVPIDYPGDDFGGGHAEVKHDGWGMLKAGFGKAMKAAEEKSKQAAAAAKEKYENFDSEKAKHDTINFMNTAKDKTVEAAKVVAAKTKETHQTVVQSETYQNASSRTQEAAVAARDATVSAAANVRDGAANAVQNAPDAGRVLWFTIYMIIGILMIFSSLWSLPMIVISPEKFVLSFTIGSMFILWAVATMKGKIELLQAMFTLKRMPFSGTYFISLFGTLYCSLVSRSVMWTLIFGGLQVATLMWFLASFVPGGYNMITGTFNMWFKSVSFLISMSQRANDTRGLLPV